MSPMPRILIITGEASGDLHGANLVKALRQTDPALSIVGIGGALMKAAGAELVPECPAVGCDGYDRTGLGQADDPASHAHPTGHSV